MKTVLIAGAASYYADSITAVSQLLTSRPVPHYLIFDFMAEGTIARMARLMASDPEQELRGRVCFHPHRPESGRDHRHGGQTHRERWRAQSGGVCARGAATASGTRGEADGRLR